MIPRRRPAAGGEQTEPPTLWTIKDTTEALHHETPPHLRVVLGGVHPCPPGPPKQHVPATNRDGAAEASDPMLAGRVTLVVDDEPMILEILAEHCASLGMEVYEAADGVGALTQIETRPEIEMLVTDVRMPGLDGPALVERALALRPGIKVIFVTGYTTQRSSAWPILRKPFDLDELEEALRCALLQQGP